MDDFVTFGCLFLLGLTVASLLFCPLGEAAMHERIDMPPIGSIAGSLWSDRLQPAVFDQGGDGSTKPGPIVLVFLIRPVEVAFAHPFVLMCEDVPGNPLGIADTIITKERPVQI